VKPISLKPSLFLVFLIVALRSFCFDCRAAEPNIVSRQQKSSDGYCGIYCLYAAMKFFGVSVDPNELIKLEYIGSANGSSLAELKKAAQEHGLFTVPVSRLSTKDLRRLSLPIIIHVKSSPSNKKYDHYELFFGSKQEQALIYDPPTPIESVEFWTLAPRWDGSGLLISNKPINPNFVFASSRLRFAGYGGIAVLLVLAARLGQRCLFDSRPAMSRKQKFLLSIGQCMILVLISAFIAIAYHSYIDEGLLLRKQATQAIQLAYKSNHNNIHKTSETK
jgi:hypothetical protein